MQVEISFTFFHREHQNLNNDTIYAIRRRVAQMFEDSEFGLVLETDDDKFVNTFAVPMTDEYYTPENQLFISFHFAFPFHHGNPGTLLLQNIPRLFDWLRARDPALGLVTRTTYLQ